MGTVSPGTMQRRPRLLWLLWLAFVVRGAWYCAVLPAWEGYDEPYHFAALQHVAGGQGLPHSDTPISLEVQKSLHLLPLPWELQFHAIPQPLTTHDDFWKLSADARDRRIGDVRRLDPDDGMRPATEPVFNYESQQAPLYYCLFAVPLRSMSALPLLSRVYWLRVLNLLLASAVLPLVFWIAQRVLGSDRQAVGVTALVVLAPEMMINLARVSNEALALVCYTVMLAAAVVLAQKPQSWNAWLVVGAALGCGLLTKAYFLTAVPAVLVIAVVWAWPRKSGDGKLRPAKVVTRLSCALLIAFLIAGRWYARVHHTTGSWSGQGDDVAMHRLSLLQKLAALPQVNWKSGVLSVLVSHVWFGAWSFLRVPDRTYKLAFAVIALGVLGVVWRLARRQGSSGELRAIVTLSAIYLGFWAGLAYNVLVTFLNQGVSASTGWYLYAAVAAEVVLLVWGLQAFMPGRVVLPLLAVAVAALDLYGIHALLMPYYSGLSWHVGESVPVALRSTLTQLPVVFTRLSLLRPEWLNSSALLGLWAGYWIATLGTVLAVIAQFWNPSAADSVRESSSDAGSSN